MWLGGRVQSGAARASDAEPREDLDGTGRPQRLSLQSLAVLSGVFFSLELHAPLCQLLMPFFPPNLPLKYLKLTSVKQGRLELQTQGTGLQTQICHKFFLIG